jgi:glycerophosphoryl diester phosphodiesterase
MPSLPDRRLERIGHRGIPVERKENTLAGFLLAVELGADAVELDTHLSADGVVVVHHDETVAGRPIAALSWKELSAIDLGGGVTLPTLDQVLAALAGRATVYVELKGASIEHGVVSTVRRHSTAVALHSFDHSAIERVQKSAPDIPRGILLDRAVTNPIQAMRRAVQLTGARDVWPHWSLVSADLQRAADELGCRVIVWTVNTLERARHLRSLGVTGICSDDVRILANL